MNWEWERGCPCTLCLMRQHTETVYVVPVAQDKPVRDSSILYTSARIIADLMGDEGIDSEYTRGQIELAVNMHGYDDDGSDEREMLRLLIAFEQWSQANRG